MLGQRTYKSTIVGELLLSVVSVVGLVISHYQARTANLITLPQAASYVFFISKPWFIVIFLIP